MIEAEGGQLAQPGQQRGGARCGVVAEVGVGGGGLLDLRVVPPRVVAVPAQDVKLALEVDLVAGARMEAAGLLRREPKPPIASASPANPHSPNSQLPD